MSRDFISLNIPAKAEYISVARLAIAGVAATNLGFNIEEIDDLKVSLGEACVNVLKLQEKDEIHMEFEVKDGSIVMFVEGVQELTGELLKEHAELNLSILIIESLMDEVNFQERGLEMIKYTGDDSNGND